MEGMQEGPHLNKEGIPYPSKEDIPHHNREDTLVDPHPSRVDILHLKEDTLHPNKVDIPHPRVDTLHPNRVDIPHLNKEFHPSRDTLQIPNLQEQFLKTKDHHKGVC